MYPALIFAFTAAGVVQSVCGFGSSVLIMMILPFFMDVIASSALSGSISTGLAVMLAWHYRKKLRPKAILLPALFFCVSSLSILPFVRSLDMDSLGVALGIFFMLLSLYFLFFSKKVKLKGSLAAAVICGGFSGLLSALFAVGGPLITLYYVSVTEDREDYFACTQGFFAITTLVMLCGRIANGLYTADLIPYTLLGLVCVKLGSAIGKKLSGHINGKAFEKMVYSAVGISGFITMLENIM